jgi:hypothetical protein
MFILRPPSFVPTFLGFALLLPRAAINVATNRITTIAEHRPWLNLLDAKGAA